MGHGAGPLRRLQIPLNRVTLALSVVVLAAVDWASERAGGSTFPGGPLDDIAHLLTTMLVLWALGPRSCRRFLVPALIASVAIDADHIPDRLGYSFLTQGTPRPYTHSLLTIAVVLAGAVIWRRRRDAFVGVALGLGIHFWRDLSEAGSGVSLLWPWTEHSFSLPHASYVAVMVAIVALDAFRSWRPFRVRERLPSTPSPTRTPAEATAPSTSTREAPPDPSPADGLALQSAD